MPPVGCPGGKFRSPARHDNPCRTFLARIVTGREGVTGVTTMRTATRVAMERLVILDRAIRSGEHPNAANFARRMEVDARTVQRDIEFLRDRFRAPLTFDRRRNGYAYA